MFFWFRERHLPEVPKRNIYERSRYTPDLCFFRYMDELFGFLLRLLDEKLFGEGGFLFSSFFSLPIFYLSHLVLLESKKKGEWFLHHRLWEGLAGITD